MGWRDEPSRRPRTTISGRPVTDQEDIDTLPRRARMAAAATRLLSDHKLAQTDAIGTPVGDDYGMADLVARLQPLFATESSFARWVALRGALLFLDRAFSTDAEWRSAMLAMGLRVEPDPYSDEQRVVPVEQNSSMTAHQRAGLVGLFHSLEMKLGQYDSIASSSIPAVLANPMWYVNELMSLEYIAWSSVALLRTGNAAAIWDMPEPGRLDDGVGWYTDPVFAQSERYWDGQDWTARVRVRKGRGWDEGRMPLA